MATRLLTRSQELVRALWYRTFALSWVRFGRKVRFLGRIHCLGVSGDIQIGDECLLGAGITVSVANGGRISIGPGSSINQGTTISALQSVAIGAGCRIGEFSSIRDNDHRIVGKDPIRSSGFTSKSVVIGDNVWIGRNVTIMLGSNIGEGAVIGANSFVNRDIPAYAIAVGTPARIIRLRE